MLDLDILKKNLKHLAYRRKLAPIYNVTGATISKEILYQNMLVHAMEAEGLPPVAFYPVRAGANYTLLYIIFRLLTDTKLNNIIEFGAGQSTLLINSVATKRELQALTIETDAGWAKMIGDRVSHPVLHKPFKPQQGSQRERYVDLQGIEGRKFDLVVVDGPNGTPRNSRASSLDILASQLADDFVVVFDDAERPGEQDTVLRFAEMTPSIAGCHVITGAKCQVLLFSEGYRAVQYF